MKGWLKSETGFLPFALTFFDCPPFLPRGTSPGKYNSYNLFHLPDPGLRGFLPAPTQHPETSPPKLQPIEYLFIFKPLIPKTILLEQQISNSNHNSKNRKLPIVG